MKLYKLLFFLVICFFISGCVDESSKSGQFNIFVFDTIVDITISDHYTEELENDIRNELERLELKFSRYIETSEISKINNNSGKIQVISDELNMVLQEAINYSNLSEGMFDITLGPIIDLWSIGSEMQNVPSETSINQMLEYVDYQQIKINDNEIFILEGMSLDFGGILKGYAADQIKIIFDENNVSSGIINLGGNVYVHGKKENEDWRVGIRNPLGESDEHLGILNISDKSIVTSGPYERYFIDNNIRFHHLFNPFTGYPAENQIEGVTIVSDRSIDGDALSTSIYTMGIKKGLVLIKELEGVDCIIITKENDIYMTEGLKNNFVLTNGQFIIKD